MRVALILASLVLAAGPASAGHWVAAEDAATGPTPAANATADCRVTAIWNQSEPTCQTTRYAYGGWCIGDEIARLFRLDLDPCLAGCDASSGDIVAYSGVVEFRLVGHNCNGGYPLTTYPLDGVFAIYGLDPVLSTPDAPVPASTPLCVSSVVTIPSLTATSATDPARDVMISFPLGSGCQLSAGSYFGAFKFAYIPPEALYTYCEQGGMSGCPWWVPGLLGLNGALGDLGHFCAAHNATYVRSEALFGGTNWYENYDPAVGLICDFGFHLDTSCGSVGTKVERTTWGTIKGLMNR